MTLSYSQRRSLAKRADRNAARWDREAAETIDAARQADHAEFQAARAAQAERDAEAPRDVDGLEAGDWVRDRYGWHQVVRVNRKTVTVSTPFSWTDTIRFAAVVETRKAEPVTITRRPR